MGNSDQSFPVKIVIQAVDELTKPLLAVNAQFAKLSAPLKRITGEFSRLAHASGISHLVGEMNEVREKAGEVGKEALELGTKLVTMEALGVGATFELAKSMAEAGHEIGETSKLLGVHTGWLQEMQYAGARAGVSTEDLNRGLYKLSKSIGESAAYTGEGLVAFRALGINVRDARGHIKTMESILPVLADKLNAVHNASVRNALAAKIFGREGGVNMVKLLGEGSKGMVEAAARAKELGFAMGEDGVKSSEEFMKSYVDVQYSLIGLRNTIGATLLPAIKDAMGAFVQFIGSHRAEIKKFADDFAKNIPQMVTVIETTADGIFSAVKRIIAVFEGVSSVIGPVNTALLVMAFTIGAPLLSSLASLAVSLVQLAPTLLLVGMRIRAMAFGPIITAFGDLFELITTGTPIMEAFNLVLATSPIGLIAGIVALGVAGYELIKHWDVVKKFFASLWDGITAGLDAIKSKLGWFTYLIPGIGQLAAGRDIYNSFAGPSGAMAPPVGAQQSMSNVAEQRQGVSSSKNETAIKVSFDNAPKGTRVRTEKSSGTPLDLSLGYAMVHP